MKPNIFLLAIAVSVFFTACQLSTKNTEEQSSDSTEVNNDPGTGEQDLPADEGPAEGRGIEGKPVILENTASRQFDGQVGEEMFRVALLGDSALNGTVAFTITNADDELIYSDEFPAIMLAATYDESVDTPEEQEQLIKKRIDNFFGEKSFKTPAIEGDQPPHDSFFVNKATYDNLKSTDAPGFVYVIGKENGKFIAWSALEGKVVMYFNCC